MTNYAKLDNLVTEIHRLNNYFETAPKALQLPSKYLNHHFKAMEILREEAVEIYDHILEVEIDPVTKQIAKSRLKTVFKSL